MKHLVDAARLGAHLLCCALLIAGCNQNQSKSKGATTEGASDACTQYQAKLCKEAGETSSTCSELKSTVELLPPAACEAALANVDFSIKKLGDKRKKCTELVDKLCAELGQETQTCGMVKERTKEFPPEQCESMLQNYDKVLADLKRMEERNKPLSDDKFAAIKNGEAPAFGPEQAVVTIVEFSDFECPFCSRAAKVAGQVKEKYGDKVRFVFRQFPLPFHKNADLAAQASLAAADQGKFWEMHDKMFENQRALDRGSLEKYAKEIGLDMAKFKKALDEKTYASAVESDVKLGKDTGVDATPTMFLNGERVPNPTDFEAVSKQIEKELAEG